ncbi:hypothetical protein G5I_08531 [Acromyrmex echinatior]|uniref:Uncharacterized protein n=1 Tax=Acromyrmex echinatior TaxID=103372 RepID=F4WRS8_ACREC|nr:hypothetical protein G5I_08531 [Acromyrmex echinatior]
MERRQSVLLAVAPGFPGPALFSLFRSPPTCRPSAFKKCRILLVCTVPGLRHLSIEPETAGSTIGPARSQCLRSLCFKVDRYACAHACARTYTRMDVLSSCTDHIRTYTYGR